MELAHHSLERRWAEPTVFTVDDELLRRALETTLSRSVFGGSVRRLAKPQSEIGGGLGFGTLN